MAKNFNLPDIGEGLVEAEIVRWRVAVGEPVAVDEVVVEVETDKAVVEIPSPFAGTLLRHGGAEGDVVAVGALLFSVGDGSSGDAPPIVGTLSEEALDLTTPASANARNATGKVQALPSVRKFARELAVDLGAVTGSGPRGRVTRDDVFASAGPPGIVGRSLSPLVRRLAIDLGVDLATVPGSGPGGRITRDDVVAAAGAAAVALERPARVDASDERRPLSKLRRTIAANLTRSWTTIPQVTAFDEVDVTRLLEIRKALQARHNRKVAIEALVMAGLVPVLRRYPEFNASLDGDELVVHQRYDIGIAVDTADGLLVASVRDVGSKGVLALSAEVEELGARARSRSLTTADLSAQTFTLSNIGAVGGGFGTPIVPFGTVAILSVGRATPKPIVQDGQIVAAPVMPLSLSYDHRVVDGAGGRRFLAMLVEHLAEPALLLA